MLSKYTSEINYFHNEIQQMEEILNTKETYIHKLTADLSNQRNEHMQLET